MMYDPAYLHQAMWVEISNRAIAKYNLVLHNVRCSYRECPESQTLSGRVIFQYECEGRIQSAYVDITGPREDVLDVDIIVDRIAQKCNIAHNSPHLV